MANTFDYIKTTNRNLQAKDAIFDAVVVANYGDPGIDEDYHADILSRYVICKIESANRTLTGDRYKNMLVVVKRPKELWVSYQGGFLGNPAAQSRIDAELHTNIGAASNYTVNAIPRINTPYTLGEKIKIKLIKDTEYHFLTADDTFFQSQCNLWSAQQMAYGSWHTQGLNSHAYISQNNGENNLRMKTVYPQDNLRTSYGISLNKTQYEAFLLSMFPEKAGTLVTLFNHTNQFNFYYETYGGYVFAATTSVALNFVKYEDINVGNKARVGSANCMPLIVTAPDTFVTPKTRTSGTVNYVPTYIERG